MEEPCSPSLVPTSKYHIVATDENDLAVHKQNMSKLTLDDRQCHGEGEGESVSRSRRSRSSIRTRTRTRSRRASHSRSKSDKELDRNAAKTAAAYYGECFMEGIGVKDADKAARHSHKNYKKWWLQQHFQAQTEDGSSIVMTSLGDEYVTVKYSDLPVRVPLPSNKKTTKLNDLPVRRLSLPSKKKMEARRIHADDLQQNQNPTTTITNPSTKNKKQKICNPSYQTHTHTQIRHVMRKSQSMESFCSNDDTVLMSNKRSTFAQTVGPSYVPHFHHDDSIGLPDVVPTYTALLTRPSRPVQIPLKREQQQQQRQQQQQTREKQLEGRLTGQQQLHVKERRSRSTGHALKERRRSRSTGHALKERRRSTGQLLHERRRSTGQEEPKERKKSTGHEESRRRSTGQEKLIKRRMRMLQERRASSSTYSDYDSTHLSYSPEEPDTQTHTHKDRSSSHDQQDKAFVASIGPSLSLAAEHLDSAKLELICSLAVSGGDVTTSRFLVALGQLRALYAKTGFDARLSHTSSNCHLEGNWLTLSRPHFTGCLGQNSKGDYMYTLGRMSFDMFSPSGLVCSMRGTFNNIQMEKGALRSVPKSLREEVAERKTILRRYDISIAFEVEPDSPVFGPSSPNHNVNKPLRGTITTYGYVLPDPNKENRLSIWFSGGKIESNVDEEDKALWKQTFGNGVLKRDLQQKAKIIAAKLLLGANVPYKMEDDGSMEFSLLRPIGGHGTAYVDVLFLDHNLRIVQGHRGSLFVLSRVSSSSPTPHEYTKPSDST